MSDGSLGAVSLPHTGTARLLTHVVHSGPEEIQAVGRVPAAHPLATGGRAPSFLALELGAQAAGAMEAIGRALAGGDGSARIGYLVRVREALLLTPDLPVDTPLFVTARLEGAAPPVSVYRVSVGIDDAEHVECVSAILSTYSGTR